MVSMLAVSFSTACGGTPAATTYSAIAVDSCSMKPPFCSGGGLCGVADPDSTTYIFLGGVAVTWRRYSSTAWSRRETTQGGRPPESVMPPATTTTAS